MVTDGTLMNMVIAHICGIICNELQRTNQNLEKENKSLKMQVDFLKEQLAYKTFGKPNINEKT